MKFKICPKCKVKKNITQFTKSVQRKDNLNFRCKKCQKIERAKSYKKNKKLFFERNKKYGEKNPNYYKNYLKKYNQKYLVKKRRKVIHAFKYANNINYRLSRILRSRLKQALMRNSKSKKTFQLLDCSIEFFRNYLENLFTDKMTWDKFRSGKIHIDHIKPCSSFNLSKEKDQRKCFHYTNLQPLYAIDNIRKGNKYNK